MAGKRKVYAAEFKLRVVQIIAELKHSVADFVREPGATENRLHDWKKALATKGTDAFPGSGHLTPLDQPEQVTKALVEWLEA